MDQIKSILKPGQNSSSASDLENQSFSQRILNQAESAVELTTMQRLWGFVICVALSVLCLVLASTTILSPARFAVLYTIGALAGLISTFFLMGPKKQFSNMMEKLRWIPSVVYVVALIATLIAAFAAKSTILVIVLIIIQMGAFLWYCSTYIPGGQQFLGRLFGMS